MERCLIDVTLVIQVTSSQQEAFAVSKVVKMPFVAKHMTLCNICAGDDGEGRQVAEVAWDGTAPDRLWAHMDEENYYEGVPSDKYDKYALMRTVFKGWIVLD